MMVVIGSRVEEELSSRRLRCECGARLAPWGWARPRRVEGLNGAVRPRRGRCGGCSRTHVLLPSSVPARCSVTTSLLGRAAELAAAGRGFRMVARVLGWSSSTTRRRLRALRRCAEVVVGAIVAGVQETLGRAVARARCVLVELVAMVRMVNAEGRCGWQFLQQLTNGLLGV